MPIRNRQIRAAYLSILGRPPKSLAEVEDAKRLNSIDELVRELTLGEELFSKNMRLVEMRIAGNVEEVRPLEVSAMIFLHLPKCAGTSLHNTLVSWYGEENTHKCKTNNLYWCSSADLASKTLFSGHFDYYSTRLIPGPHKTITFLRNPVERLISLYHFHRAHTNDYIKKTGNRALKMAKENSIDAYFQSTDAAESLAINNSMVRFLSNIPQLPGVRLGETPAARQPLEIMLSQAKHNIESFFFVGFVDNYEASLRALAQRLDRPPTPANKGMVLDDIMKRSPNMEPIDRQKPSSETVLRLKELTKYDQELYHHAQMNFSV